MGVQSSRAAVFCIAVAFAFAACGHASPPAAPPAPDLQRPAQTLSAFPGRHHLPLPPKPKFAITASQRAAALAAGWQPVAAPAPIGAGTTLLMTDGTVMVHNGDASNWYALVPDKTGSYVNGKWVAKASLPSGYAPLYYASAVLRDGKLIIDGGEYNNGNEVWTNQSAIYNPITNTWKSVAPPSGWSSIGDAPATVLANGTYMLGNCCDVTDALFNESTLTWTAVGTGKADSNNEEGWSLLPNGDILAADAQAAPGSELYNPSTQVWSSAGNLPKNLVQLGELGPQMLRPNGTVFVAGANKYTAVYSTSTGTWAAGPNFPVVNTQQLDSADGPAALLTNGNVLLALSPGVYNTPAYFYIFNGTGFKAIAGPPNAVNDSSFNISLLLLPTGQILETDFSTDVEIYTPSVTAETSIAPSITSVPTTLTHGSTYTIKGLRFNGYSQASTYGDDEEHATNYPLVRITNTSTGDVFYARTKNFSSMGVAMPSTAVSARFSVPSGIELGASTLVVVANGIASTPVNVTIQ